jgi:Flp pilus assembly protein TadG
MLRALLSRFIRSTRGVVAVEFALSAPLFVLLLLGMAEIGRYELLHLKLANSAMNVADLIARGERASRAEIALIGDVMPSMLSPFETDARLRLIVSGVTQDAGQTNPQVAWRTGTGAATLGASRIGAEGATAAVPADLVVIDGEALIVTEVYYDYEPWLLGIVPGRTLYDVAYFRPRIALLRTLEN